MNSPVPGPPLKRRILSPATLLSFGVAVLLIVFLLSRFDIDLAATWQRIRGADRGAYLLAFGIYYLSFPVRGYRWRLLVRSSHPQGTPRPLPSLFTFGRYIYLGWFVNTISWFRMGDAYRGYLLSSQGKLSFSRTMGSILAERVIDLVVVSTLLAVAAALLWAGRSTATTYLLAVALLLAVLALTGVAGMALLGERLRRKLPAPLERIYRNFHEGTLGSFRQLPLLLLISSLTWSIEVVRLSFMAQALGLEVAAPLLLFVALAGALLTTVPITPGGVGIVETGMTGIFLLALPRADAISLTLLDRSVSYLSILVLGSFLFLLQQVWRRRVATVGGKTVAGTGDG